MIPEHQPIKLNPQIQAAGTSAKDLNLNQIEFEILQLLKNGQFSIRSLCEYFYKTGSIMSFRSLWNLFEKLEKNNLLLSPRLNEWKQSNLNNKIQKILNAHTSPLSPLQLEELTGLPFFRNLKKEVVQLLTASATVISVESGFTLCRQGQTDRVLYVLLEGQANIYRSGESKQRMLIARIEKGAIIGEVSFFLGEKRTADVIMSTAGKVIKIIMPTNLEQVIRSDAAKAMQERFWLLQAMVKSPLFCNLPETTFDALLQQGRSLPLKEGQKVFAQGDLSDNFYIIIQGRIAIIQNNQKINLLNSGEAFGEIAFLKFAERRTAGAIAEIDSLLIEIPYFKLLNLLFDNLSLAILIEKIAIDRLQKDMQRRNAKATG